MSKSTEQSRHRLPNSTLLAYGVSDLPVMLASMPLMLYMNRFYSSDIGIPVILLANFLLFARMFDLITDPLVGYLSDHTRTRWGRRKPWMIASLPFLLIGIYKVYIPVEGAGIGYLFTWLMVMWLGWTMLVIPYYAWGAELSSDYDERTKITGYRAGLGSLGSLLAITFPVVGGMFFGIDSIADIMRITAYAAMVFIPCAVLITVTTVKEKPTTQRSSLQMFDGLKIMMKNGSFRWLIIVFFIASTGTAVLMPLNVFYSISVLEATEKQVPLLMFFGSFAGLAGIPFWVAVSKRYGKHRAWIGGFLLVTAFSPMYLFLGPGDFYMMLPFAAFSAFGTGSFIALPNSMKADVIDIDIARSGENRAAMYFSAWSLVTKLALTLGGSLSLWALGWISYNPAPGFMNSPETLLGLKLVYVFLPSSLFVLAGIIVWNYPITKERQTRIRAAIDRRDARRRAAAEGAAE